MLYLLQTAAEIASFFEVDFSQQQAAAAAATALPYWKRPRVFTRLVGVNTADNKLFLKEAQVIVTVPQTLVNTLLDRDDAG